MGPGSSRRVLWLQGSWMFVPRGEPLPTHRGVNITPKQHPRSWGETPRRLSQLETHFPHQPPCQCSTKPAQLAGSITEYAPRRRRAACLFHTEAASRRASSLYGSASVLSSGAPKVSTAKAPPRLPTPLPLELRPMTWP
ncbi:hypothetical protein GQ53DRAFT_747075 [Thozetella sp. PMI_491]|nr:hypothetical protein GQ53DRAFT_747075 [Thozetella sp. PMI_491]